MALQVFMPSGQHAARRWVVDTVCSRLSDRWTCVEGYGADWEIRWIGEGSSSLTLRMPDVFFQRAMLDWLGTATLPCAPLPIFDPAGSGLRARTSQRTVPVLFGDAAPVSVDSASSRLGIDVFGAAFFMLSRYEELVLHERDAHDRFPAAASIARACGFLGRPIIDEYVEILWSVMARLWPNIRRRPARFQVKPSHDVDEPSRDAFRGLKAVLKESAGDALKRRNFRRAWQGPWHWLYGRWALHTMDPYNTFDRLMDLSDEIGTKSTFYVMAGCTNPAYDRGYGIRHPAIRRLMRRIHERGHEIGLHPSFETYRRPDLLRQEAETLRTALSECGVRQDSLGARMHYLRWRCPETWRAMFSAGMDHDATLGFADSAGFRGGTCHEYTAFDVLADRPINLRVRPLIAMDVSILDDQYMGHGISPGARAVLAEMRRCCETVDGNFSVLWHNNEFQRPGSWDLYRSAIRPEQIWTQ